MSCIRGPCRPRTKVSEHGGGVRLVVGVGCGVYRSPHTGCYTFVQILECQANYMVKEEIEDCWSEDASLSDTVVDVEWC